MNSSSNKPLTRIMAMQRVVMFAVIVYLALTVPLSAGMIKVASEQTVVNFKYPESVAYDPEAKVLYVSEFGSQLKPTLKDGKGRISKVSLNGKVLHVCNKSALPKMKISPFHNLGGLEKLMISSIPVFRA